MAKYAVLPYMSLCGADASRYRPCHDVNTVSEADTDIDEVTEHAKISHSATCDRRF